jgi:prolipoprotein diacylglyceryltransferase
LLWIGTRGVLRSGGLFLFYVAAYSFGRFWIEGLRIDESELILGLRLNIWVSITLFIFAAIATFDRRVRRPR